MTRRSHSPICPGGGGNVVTFPLVIWMPSQKARENKYALCEGIQYKLEGFV